MVVNTGRRATMRIASSITAQEQLIQRRHASVSRGGLGGAPRAEGTGDDVNFSGTAPAADEVDAVADEVNPVADEVDAVADEVDAVVDEIDAVVDEVDAVADEVDAIADEVDAIVDEVDAVELGVDADGGAIDG